MNFLSSMTSYPNVLNNFRLFSRRFSASVFFIGIFLLAELSAKEPQLAPLEIDFTEKKLVSIILQNEPDALTLLEKAVNINSGTMNFTGVKQVADLFAKEFEQLGFETEWVSAEKFNRAGHLIASFGTQGPRILMIGHLDTVFTRQSSFQKFNRLDSSLVKGPGITDMKGGDVIIIHSLKALKEAAILNQFQFKVVLTGDEENRGRPVMEASKVLLEAGLWADIALGFEDGDGDPRTAVISRRGSSNWHLNVTGKAAHSSQIFQKDIGYGAIYETARILEGFRKTLSVEENLTYNPGLIVGGSTAKIKSVSSTGEAFGKNNVIASSAHVSGDIRAISPAQLARAWSQMKRVVGQSLAGTNSEISFDEGYPPMAASRGNKQLLSLYSKLSIEHGFGKVSAVNPRNAGAADISFVAADVKMALDGLGLMGVKGHTVNETANIKTLSQQTIRASVLMYRLLDKAK